MFVEDKLKLILLNLFKIIMFTCSRTTKICRRNRTLLFLTPSYKNRAKFICAYYDPPLQMGRCELCGSDNDDVIRLQRPRSYSRTAYRGTIGIY